MNKIIVILVFLLISFFGISQTLSGYIKNGDKEFENGNYYAAAYLYRRALDKNNMIVPLQYKYAESLRLSKDYKKASKWYRKVYSNDNEKFPLARYWYAGTLKYLGKYTKAAKTFKRFSKNKRSNIELKEYVIKAEHEALVCEGIMSEDIVSQDIDINHFDTSLNSKYGEFCPFEFNDSCLYYSSFREFKKKDSVVFRSHILVKNFNDDKSVATILDTSFYEAGFHYALSPGRTKTEVFFSKCPIYKDTTACKIYVANLINGRLINAKILEGGINKEGYNSLHPYFTNYNGKGYMLFSSDRPNGFGKKDIWYCIMQDEITFDNCMNAGDKINTIEDEVTPFYYEADTTLYFSSKWHNSYGGFDIFKAIGDFNFWQSPKNIGKPINSSFDDLYYSFNANTRNAWFVSNREGTLSRTEYPCCNDIFGYVLPVSHYDSIRLQQKIEEHNNYITKLEEELTLLTPLELFFDNDMPNPKSLDTITSTNISELLLAYYQRKSEYKNIYSDGISEDLINSANAEIDDFFEDIASSKRELERFTEHLVLLLRNNKRIYLNVRSYSSPLNSVSYNEKLAKRRISSLMNFLQAYNDSLLLPYFKSGQLKVDFTNFGETQASEKVSDNLYDVRNSVYSPTAARERKISIHAVKIIKINPDNSI